MTRQARHALPGLDPSAAPSRETGGMHRSGKKRGAQGPAGSWGAVPWPAADPPPAPDSPAKPDDHDAAAGTRAGPAHARSSRAGAAGAVAYLVVLACAAVGMYIAWHQGSHGGGRGAALAGSALIAAGAVRLVLPGKLAGLLASRGRLIDVLMLTVFGAGLLVAGLVLPRLWPLSVQRKMAAANERETRITCPKSRWQILSSS